MTGMFSATTTTSEITCTSETLTIGCPERHVILVKRALYGRMEPGRCITSEYSHAIGCYADVTGHLQDLCTGQNRCSLMVASIDAIAQPCGKDFKSYLDIEHRCASASFIDDCHNTNQTVLTSPNGHLILRPNKPFSPQQEESSSIAKELPACPWVLLTESGKKFNVTWRVPSNAILLADALDLGPLPDLDSLQSGFHVQSQSSSLASPSHLSPLSSSSSSSSFCGVSWKFVEVGEETPYAACVSGVRKSQMRFYESKSNRLEIHFTGVLHGSHVLDFQDQQRLPLLEYNAIGCSQYRPPSGAFVSSQEDNVAVLCNVSGQIWHITCQDGAWVGNVGSCENGRDDDDSTSIISKPSAMPRLELKLDRAGVITAIVVGVLLGGTFGAMMLLAIFVLKKRDRKRRRCKRKATPTAATTHFSETTYNSNTPPLRHHQTNLQQLHVTADVISGCGRLRCDDLDCHGRCLQPPSYHVLTTSPVSCTCHSSSHNSPGGCCYSDQTQLISLPTSEEQNYFPANTPRGVTDLTDNVVISLESEYSKDDNLEGGKCSGPILRYPNSDYLAVKCDDVDD